MEQSKLNTSKLLETKDYIYTKEHFWLLEMVSSLWELFLALGSPAEAAVVEKDVMAPQIPTRQRFRVEKPDQSMLGSTSELGSMFAKRIFNLSPTDMQKH